MRPLVSPPERGSSFPTTVIEIRDDSPEIVRDPPSTSTRPPHPPHPFFQPRSRSAKSIIVLDLDSASVGGDRASAIDLTNDVDSPIKRRPPPSSRADPIGPEAPPWPVFLGDHINAKSRQLSDPARLVLPRFPRRTRPASQSITLLDLQDDTWHHRLSSLRSFSPAQSSELPSPSPRSSQRQTMSGADLWTSKYRPTRAMDVLGNELNSEYTKQWLQALELVLDNAPSTTTQSVVRNSQPKSASQGAKRARVVRTVEKPLPKKKKRKMRHGYDDDWVVDEEDEDQDDAGVQSEDPEDEDTFLESLAVASSRSSSPVKRFSVPPPSLKAKALVPDVFPRYDFSTRLTNALLIAGPSGCGKTAAVYACAEELGWSVFEVYPGMGKRGAAQISAMLDGVGKNHTLAAQRSGEVKFTASDVLFAGKGSKIHGRPSLNGNSLDRIFFPGASKNKGPFDREVIDLELDGPVEDQGTHDSSRRTTSGIGTNTLDALPQVNQSIILIEEVDLLFQGESGFWQAVIDVIKESRRPVIMTCTGKPFLLVDTYVRFLN